MIETLTIIDYFSIALISVFGVLGFFNGLIKEIFSAAAWILSLILAWLYGPLLFPYVSEISNSVSIKNFISFIILFLTSFILLKLLGSIFSKFISAIGLKGLDKMLGMFFGSLKVSIILSSVFIFNINYLDKNDWWIQSHSREYSIKFYELSQSVFDKWIDGEEIILKKDDPKILL